LGDIIRTKSDGKVEITFNNENVLRLASSTRVEIKEHMTREDNNSSIVKMYRGMVQAISSPSFIKRVSISPNHNTYEVHTLTAVCGIRGSNMIVSFNSGTTSVLFVTGKGYIFNPEMRDVIIPITAGQISFVEKVNTPPSPPRQAMGAEIAVQVKTLTPTKPLTTLTTSTPTSTTQAAVSSTQTT
jgi:hypothetical protein